MIKIKLKFKKTKRKFIVLAILINSLFILSLLLDKNHIPSKIIIKQIDIELKNKF